MDVGKPISLYSTELSVWDFDTSVWSTEQLYVRGLGGYSYPEAVVSNSGAPFQPETKPVINITTSTVRVEAPYSYSTTQQHLKSQQDR